MKRALVVVAACATRSAPPPEPYHITLPVPLPDNTPRYVAMTETRNGDNSHLSVSLSKSDRELDRNELDLQGGPFTIMECMRGDEKVVAVIEHSCAARSHAVAAWLRPTDKLERITALDDVTCVCPAP